MGKIDLIQTVFDSYALLKAHYREVAIPIIFLLIASGIGHMGGSGGGRGSSFSDKYDDSGSAGSSTANAFGSLLLVNAMGSLESMLGIGVVAIILLIIAMIVIGLVIYILNFAVQFYVFEHFYAILLQKKITGSWQERMTKHTLKVLVIQLFWLVVTVALFALPAFQIWSSIPLLANAFQADTDSEMLSGLISVLSPVLVMLLIAGFAMLLIGFLLSPLFVYYAMEGRGFFESMGKAFSLVTGNLFEFLLISAAFGALGLAGWGASIALCCFAWIISPIIDVFLALMWGLTLMQMKLKLEAK